MVLKRKLLVFFDNVDLYVEKGVFLREVKIYIFDLFDLETGEDWIEIPSQFIIQSVWRGTNIPWFPCITS